MDQHFVPREFVRAKQFTTPVGVLEQFKQFHLALEFYPTKKFRERRKGAAEVRQVCYDTAACRLVQPRNQARESNRYALEKRPCPKTLRTMRYISAELDYI